MNPSVINKKKIIDKFKLEKINKNTLNKEYTNIEDDIKDDMKHDMKYDIEDLTNKLDKLDSKSNSKSIKIIEKIPLSILARLPSLIKFNNKINSEAMSKDYNYYIKNIININRPKIKSNKLIHICIYNIVIKPNISPFILFLLYKEKSLYFPHLKTDNDVLEAVDLKINNIYENYTTKPIYIGFKETSNNIYVFYQTEDQYKLEYLHKDNNWWWCTISEIVNNKKILTFDIDRSVYSIFYKQPLFAVLFNNNNQKTIINRSLYFGAYENYISFIANLGLPKESPTSNLGPYYYFYNYYGAGRRAIWTQSRTEEIHNDEIITRNEYGVQKRGGIVRFLVFGNNTKFFLNRKDDVEDDSEISKKMAKDIPFIKETLKMRDVDGKWAVDFDMAYIGSAYVNKKHDKHKFRRLTAQWAVRDYYQYFPLSYHYVNTDEFTKIKSKEDAINAPYEFKSYDIE